MNPSAITPVVFRLFTTQGGGTCFYYKELNVFVTSLHIVQGEKEAAIEDVHEKRYAAQVCMVIPAAGIALLQTAHDFSHLPALGWPATGAAFKKQPLHTIGFPFDAPFQVEANELKSHKTIDDRKYMVLEEELDSWMSGGLVVTNQGTVAGMINPAGDNEDDDDINFAIPAPVLLTALQQASQTISKKFAVLCPACNQLLKKGAEDCAACGETTDDDFFSFNKKDDFSAYCEDLMDAAGIDAVQSRAGYHTWKVNTAGVQLRFFDYEEDYLFITAKIATVKKDNEALYRYVLDKKTAPFHAGMEDDDLYLSYRIHPVSLKIRNKTAISTSLRAFIDLSTSVKKYIEANFRNYIQ